MRTSPIHYIAPSAISITPNANNSHRDLAVYVAKDTWIKVRCPRAGIGMDIYTSTYQAWKIEGRNRRLADTTGTQEYTIYARLPKSDHNTGSLVFSPKTGSGKDKWQYLTLDDNAMRGITSIADATTSDSDWYVRLGDVSAAVNGLRTVTLDTGILGTDQYNDEWVQAPDNLPLRIELGCTISDEDAGPTPYVYWGQQLVLTAILVEGWIGTDIQRFDHWEITRNSGDTAADEVWNHPTGAGSYHALNDGQIVLSHARGAGDDFNGAVSSTFTVVAMGYPDSSDSSDSSSSGEELVVLKSVSINIHAETVEKYELALSANIVGYNQQTHTFDPASITARIRATDQRGDVFALTKGQFDNALLAAEYAAVGSDVWIPLTFSGASTAIATASLNTATAFAAQQSLNVRLIRVMDTNSSSDSSSSEEEDVIEFARQTIAFVRDGEDSKEREWIFYPSTVPVTFGTEAHKTPSSINGGQVSPSGAATGLDTNKNQDGWVPEGWYDEMQGTDENTPYEYGSFRDYIHDSDSSSSDSSSSDDGGRWGAFSTPKIWSHYGKDGKSLTIKSEASTYQVSASGTTAPTGTWYGTRQEAITAYNAANNITGTVWAQGTYMWTKTVITWTDGTNDTTTTLYQAERNPINSVRIDLDNEHEDFLYNDANQRLSAVVTSQAKLYDGASEVTHDEQPGLQWTIDSNGTSGVVLDNPSSPYYASINANTGLLTVNGINAASAVVKVHAQYNGGDYYAKFTANRKSQDKYSLTVTPAALTYNSSETWTTQTIVVNVSRQSIDGTKIENIHSGIYVAVLNKVSASDTEGWRNVRYDDRDGYFINVTQEKVLYNNEILVEVRKVKSGQTYKVNTPSTYTVEDYETIPINKTENGTPGTQYQRMYRSTNSGTWTGSLPADYVDGSNSWSVAPTAITSDARYRWVTERRSDNGGTSWDSGWSTPQIDAYLAENGTSISIKGQAMAVIPWGESLPASSTDGALYLMNNEDADSINLYNNGIWDAVAAAIGDGYLSNGHLWMKVRETSSSSSPRWQDMGQIKGDKGDDSVTYTLEPSVTVIPRDHWKTPKIDILAFVVHKSVGDVQSRLATQAQWSAEGLTLHYIKDGTEVSVDAEYSTEPAHHTNYHDIESLYNNYDGIITWLVKKNGVEKTRVGIGCATDGAPGDTGDTGHTGRFFYYDGPYNSGKTYAIEETQAPYVKFTNPNDQSQTGFFMLDNGGTEPANIPYQVTGVAPSFTASANNPWTLMASAHQYYIARVFFGENAYFGSFIINADWMISQYGTLKWYDNGAAQTTEINASNYNSATFGGKVPYAWFKDSDPTGTATTTSDTATWRFVPTWAVDGLTGETYQGSAHINGVLTTPFQIQTLSSAGSWSHTWVTTDNFRNIFYNVEGYNQQYWLFLPEDAAYNGTQIKLFFHKTSSGSSGNAYMVFIANRQGTPSRIIGMKHVPGNSYTSSIVSGTSVVTGGDDAYMVFTAIPCLTDNRYVSWILENYNEDMFDIQT